MKLLAWVEGARGGEGRRHLGSFVARAIWGITDYRSLAGADDQRRKLKNRRGPGPVQRMVSRSRWPRPAHRRSI
jgi:hypothetical protein